MAGSQPWRCPPPSLVLPNRRSPLGLQYHQHGLHRQISRSQEGRRSQSVRCVCVCLAVKSVHCQQKLRTGCKVIRGLEINSRHLFGSTWPACRCLKLRNCKSVVKAVKTRAWRRSLTPPCHNISPLPQLQLLVASDAATCLTSLSSMRTRLQQRRHRLAASLPQRMKVMLMGRRGASSGGTQISARASAKYMPTEVIWTCDCP